MKKNIIAESWNKIELDNESDARILYGLKKANDRQTKTKYRGISIPVVASICAILLVCSASAITYAYLVATGKLSFNQSNPQSQNNTDVVYEFEDVKIEEKELKGKISECKSVIAEQVENYNGYGSASPYAVEKEFSSIHEAIDYIGYSGLKWLQKDKSESDSSCNVIVEGNDKGLITKVSLVSNYALSDQINVDMSAEIFTDNYNGKISVGVTSYSDAFEGVDYSGKLVETNGRQFWIVDSTEFEDEWLEKIVYWQENSVIYTLNIRYKGGDKKEVDEFVTCWMNGF